MKSLDGVTATRRHIILLTDGWSTSGQYDEILAKMKAAGITLSTVGAGGGSNPFLESLATKGGGRFYSASNPASIPDIFLKETQQVSGQQIVEEPFFPILTSSSPILRGLDDGLPKLLGYNGTTAKPAAQTVLVTSRDDPLLAQWQYGLGRSVAWTSDSTGRWAKNWLAWPDFARFFSQLVSWTFPGEETDGIEATFDDVGGKTTLHVESVESDGSARDFYSTSAVVVGPGLEPVDVDLVQVAPGVYEAPLGEVEPGAYAVRVTQIKPGTSPLGRTIGLVAPTSAEYRLLGANEPFLAALRNATGGAEVLAARGSLDPQPDGDEPLHRPVAAPAHPGPAPVAARYRAAARVGGPPRVRGRRRLADECRRPTRSRGRPDGDEHEPAGRAGTGPGTTTRSAMRAEAPPPVAPIATTTGPPAAPAARAAPAVTAKAAPPSAATTRAQGRAARPGTDGRARGRHDGPPARGQAPGPRTLDRRAGRPTGIGASAAGPGRR